MNWDDLRYVLAISRSGSLSGAARRLGVDQTTVSRRLAALERDLGTPMFLRTRGGMTPTETGKAAIAEIGRMENAAVRLTESIEQVGTAPSGLVRLATMPWILEHVLIPRLGDLHAAYPDIELHGIADLHERSPGRGETELALRFELPARGTEKEVEIAELTYSTYAPVNAREAELPWAGSVIYFDRFAPQQWLEDRIAASGETVRFLSGDAGIVLAAVKAGATRALLPDLLAAREPCLRRCSEQGPTLTRKLRLLVHPDVEGMARVEAATDWIRSCFAAASDI